MPPDLARDWQPPTSLLAAAVKNRDSIEVICGTLIGRIKRPENLIRRCFRVPQARHAAALQSSGCLPRAAQY